MIKVVISGCNGAMGRALTEVISGIEDVSIVAGIDKKINAYENEYPVYESPLLLKEECDVIIDFSNPSNLNDLLKYGVINNVGLVIATTGFNEEEENKIKEASSSTRIFKSSNMSLGINVLINLVKQATNILGETFDIEIIEKHHNKKVDAPSGTAKMIANAINDELNNAMEFNYGREGNDSKRKENEIGIHAIRGGTIPGEHTVVFAGLDEVIDIKHLALSKKVFAKGAVESAKYIADKENGLYTMDDLINNK
ncbi:4-hydroxy-tetrahydrodipicolinate reductase [Romboutsia sp. 13368]|uniref:4-hydroxy-tetrahydrodipicolinate reductase n=1 Tax=Romboutsia sp. 13368 TaxID=2708053 RepID=UPI0025E645D3|nr:4-hydroxy-tetrahydrodipicolinate reductase [Romboutsia sp. 13368]